MRHLESTQLRRGRTRRRGALIRALRGTFYVKLGFIAVIALAVLLFYLRLVVGPIAVDALGSEVARALAGRLGPGWSVGTNGTALQLDRGSIAVRTLDLEIRNPQGALVLRAPDATVSLSTTALVTASLQPRSIEFRDLQLVAVTNRDGSFSLVPASAEPNAETPLVTAPAPGGLGHAPQPGGDPKSDPSPVSTAAVALFEQILQPTGLLGSLDKAAFVNARLTLVDAERRVRAQFDRVEAEFEREPGGRRFSMQLEGPRGPWRIEGAAYTNGKGASGLLSITDVPIDDVALFSGQAQLGSADVKLSGRAELAMVGERVTTLAISLETGAGDIKVNDETMPPIAVERIRFDAGWNESERRLDIAELSFRGPDTAVVLGGNLALPAGEPWKLALAAKDASIAGPGSSDAPIGLQSIDLAATGRDGGVVLDRLALRGPHVAVDGEGSFGTPDDRGGLRLKLAATNMAARAALGLWPHAVSPPVRQYLVENLRSGHLGKLSVAVALDAEGLAKANGDGPIPAESVAVDFAIKDAVLAVAKGMPPLSRMDVAGRVNGVSAEIRAPSAQMALAEGRTLALSGGSFTIQDLWPDDAVADIVFRAEGSADALAAYLQTPAVKKVAGLDVDPANLKGRTDLQVRIPLAINDIPAFEDLPIIINGTLADFTVEKAFGKDRFEGATLSLAYDQGSLSIKGEGKLAGSPASLDIRQPRGTAGELVAQFSLDDAARARRGLTFGQQLNGPVQVKVAMPVKSDGKDHPRVEMDLTKAAVADLIPGWTKAAGKPGRLAFTLVEDKGTELRDLQLDSGPVQIRGSAQLSGEGDLDKAELTSLKLSPGDDMRAQIERTGSGYRVTLRGNVADARPLLKLDRGSSRQNQDASDDEIELDLTANIVTGYNGETLTGTALKALLKGSDIRSLSLSGRLRGASVLVRTVPRPGAAPVMLLQSGDAGGLLRFADIYRRMIGGELTLQAALGDGVQAGLLTLEDFRLRDEPALRRIISQQPVTPNAEDRNGPASAPAIDSGEVQFTQAKLDFVRTAGRLDFREAVIWGPQVGFNLTGYLDIGRDRTDIAGTFVPAYGLNNAIAQVPLFGPLLAGGRHEGLFAVNFRISGAATAPILTVNPLSAVAPGFLRKLFGVGAPGDGLGAAPPAQAPARSRNATPRRSER